jgi:hypothetical protein
MTRDGKEKVTCRSKDDRSMSLILAIGRLWDTWLPMYQFAKQIIPAASHVRSSLLRQSHVKSGSDHLYILRDEYKVLYTVGTRKHIAESGHLRAWRIAEQSRTRPLM